MTNLPDQLEDCRFKHLW